jgi:cupin 2 domain-containing protein
VRLVHYFLFQSSWLRKSFPKPLISQQERFAMLPQNLFDQIPATLEKELFTDLLRTSKFRIERVVSQGHCAPEGFWYDQNQNEWVLLLSGAARLAFADEGKIELHPGSYLNIPAHERHRVEWTDPNEQTVWLAIHY